MTSLSVSISECFDSIDNIILANNRLCVASENVMMSTEPDFIIFACIELEALKYLKA